VSNDNELDNTDAALDADVERFLKKGILESIVFWCGGWLPVYDEEARTIVSNGHLINQPG
jgi:hypothetical protein